MTRVRLSGSKQLDRFLSILAEESVSRAREAAKDGETQQKQVRAQLKADKGALKVEDDAAPDTSSSTPGDEALAGADDAPPAAADPTDAAPSDDAESDPAAAAPDSDFNPTLDAIKASIRQLRSGRSVDDSQVESNLESYFDKLDDPARRALLVFMRSFAKILTGATSGAEAPKPEQPPASVHMSVSGAGEFGSADAAEAPASSPAAEPESTPSAPAAAPQPKQSAAPARPKRNTGEEEEEDTTPPIRVGSPTQESFRRHVRELLAKGSRA